MEDTFFATFKLVTGEEVLAEVCLADEDNQDFFIVSNPITITEATTIDHEKGAVVSGLVPRKWLTYSNDDMTIVNKSHIISMSEMDKFGADFYSKALLAAKTTSPIRRKIDTKKNTGYVGKVDNVRNRLKKIFDKSPDLPSGPQE